MLIQCYGHMRSGQPPAKHPYDLPNLGSFEKIARLILATDTQHAAEPDRLGTVDLRLQLARAPSAVRDMPDGFAARLTQCDRSIQTRPAVGPLYHVDIPWKTSESTGTTSQHRAPG